MSTTPLLDILELVAAQTQPHVPVNEAFRTLEVFGQLAVIAIENTPPAVVDGDSYIVGDTPTGAWVGYEQWIAYGVGGGWRFALPRNGWIAFNQTDELLYRYVGGASPAFWEPFNVSPTTTLGDLIRRGPSADESLAIGSAGQVLTVVSGEPEWAAATGAASSRLKFQAADQQSVNNTYVDSDLLVALDASSTYSIEIFLQITCHATPDMNVRVQYTGTTASFALQITNAIPAGATSIGATTTVPPVAVINANVTNTFTNVATALINTTTAGNFSVQFAQNTTSAGNPVTFHKGSWMRIEKM